LWDPGSGREQAVLTGHTGTVLAVAFSPDSRLLASGDGDGTIRLWSTNRRRLVHQFPLGDPIRAVAWGTSLLSTAATQSVITLRLASS
jgi:WD40 repeat protein